MYGPPTASKNLVLPERFELSTSPFYQDNITQFVHVPFAVYAAVCSRSKPFKFVDVFR